MCVLTWNWEEEYIEVGKKGEEGWINGRCVLASTNRASGT